MPNAEHDGRSRAVLLAAEQLLPNASDNNINNMSSAVLGVLDLFTPTAIDAVDFCAGVFAAADSDGNGRLSHSEVVATLARFRGEPKLMEHAWSPALVRVMVRVLVMLDHSLREADERRRQSNVNATDDGGEGDGDTSSGLDELWTPWRPTPLRLCTTRRTRRSRPSFTTLRSTPPLPRPTPHGTSRCRRARRRRMHRRRRHGRPSRRLRQIRPALPMRAWPFRLRRRPHRRCRHRHRRRRHHLSR